MQRKKERMNTTASFRFNFVVLALLVLALLTGCHLSQPGSASFASVLISDRGEAEIRAKTIAVFAGAGYEAMLAGDAELVFEREGTRGNEIAHGGWIEGEGVRERVRVRIVLLSPGQYRLQCQAYMVRHAMDPVLQDEVRLKKFRSRPYQKLLDEVAGRLH
jgi:hypothetical protein